MSNAMANIIDRLVDNAIRENGLKNKKTIIIMENAEKLKEKIKNNITKVY